MPVAVDPENIKILGADRMRGDLLIHFSDGMSVLYQAQFLYDIRAHDGSVAIPTDVDADGEAAEE